MKRLEMEAKYGGFKELIIAFLHGDVTDEEAEAVRNLYNPNQVAIIGISELMDVTRQLSNEVFELKRRLNAEGRYRCSL